MQERDEIEDLFALARSRRMQPSDDLMARVLADALAVQPVAAARPVAARRPVLAGWRGGWLGAMADLFGGFGALAGVGGAAVAGVMLGFVQPAPVTEMADAVWGVAEVSVDLMPDAATLMAGE